MMLILNILLFGPIGLTIWAVQMLWIPLLAAGVINGIGHYWGYRNFQAEDASTNIVPWGILIGGEELHNNHHAYASSARLSNKWYEFDIGWVYIRIYGDARPGAGQEARAASPDGLRQGEGATSQTLQAVITHRYDVLARFARSLKETWAEELRRMREHKSGHAIDLQGVKRWLHRDAKFVRHRRRRSSNEVLETSKVLDTVYSMRQELAQVWQRSTATKEQLVSQLEDWCHRAEKSGIVPLQEFSQHAAQLRLTARRSTQTKSPLERAFFFPVRLKPAELT